MDYDDEYAVRSQIEQLKTEVLKARTILPFCLGHWQRDDLHHSVETIRRSRPSSTDPHHPMTVIAGFDPPNVHDPDPLSHVDIVVNAYGSIENLPLNIRRFHWDKPHRHRVGVNGPFEPP